MYFKLPYFGLYSQACCKELWVREEVPQGLIVGPLKVHVLSYQAFLQTSLMNLKSFEWCPQLYCPFLSLQLLFIHYVYIAVCLLKDTEIVLCRVVKYAILSSSGLCWKRDLDLIKTIKVSTWTIIALASSIKKKDQSKTCIHCET